MTELIEPTAEDILNHAADLLELWGVCKNKSLYHDGRMCESGAVNAAAGAVIHYKVADGWYYKTTWDKAWKNAESAFQCLFDVGGGSMHNDHPHTSSAKAIAKVREAAQLAKTRGL